MNKKYSKAEVETEVKLTIDRCLRKVSEAREITKNMICDESFQASCDKAREITKNMICDQSFQASCDIFEGIVRLKINTLLPITLFTQENHES